MLIFDAEVYSQVVVASYLIHFLTPVALRSTGPIVATNLVWWKLDAPTLAASLANVRKAGN
jgi:hypothetical protein